MTGSQRREQLITIGRELFAERGFDGASVEEIAARALVSKPVVYEHFGGKEGIYAVIVDREVTNLTRALTSALAEGGHPRAILERTALALLDYIEANTDGFRILVRDSPVAQATGTFSSLIGDVATEVEHLLGAQFAHSGLDRRSAPMYSQMLVGMIALTGQWWLEARTPSKDVVAAHLVNLAWNGLRGMESTPQIGLASREAVRAGRQKKIAEARDGETALPDRTVRTASPQQATPTTHADDSGGPMGRCEDIITIDPVSLDPATHADDKAQKAAARLEARAAKAEARALKAAERAVLRAEAAAEARAGTARTSEPAD